MNYIGTSRTNYFHITDMKKFDQLTAGLTGNVQIVTDSDDNTMFALLGYDSMSWYSPASMNPDCYDEDDIYDKDGNPISIENIDDYNQIYDSKGECIFDRFEGDDEWDKFTSEIIKIIPENECFVYIESGHEGHRYILGFAQVITHNGSKSINLDSFIDSSVRELLGENATTKYSY